MKGYPGHCENWDWVPSGRPILRCIALGVRFPRLLRGTHPVAYEREWHQSWLTLVGTIVSAGLRDTTGNWHWTDLLALWMIHGGEILEFCRDFGQLTSSYLVYERVRSGMHEILRQGWEMICSAIVTDPRGCLWNIGVWRAPYDCGHVWGKIDAWNTNREVRNVIPIPGNFKTSQ